KLNPLARSHFVANKAESDSSWPTHACRKTIGPGIGWATRRRPCAETFGAFGSYLRSAVPLELLLLLMGAFFAAPAFATLSTRAQRGVKIVDIAVPGKKAEFCVVPKHFTNGEYSDNDLKTEAHLCEINENSNAAVCPKTNSTNPGLDVFSLPQGAT